MCILLTKLLVLVLISTVICEEKSDRRVYLDGSNLGATVDFAISIRHKGTHLCSGAIVTSLTAITAHWCVQLFAPEDLTLYSGMNKGGIGLKHEIHSIYDRQSWNRSYEEDAPFLIKTERGVNFKSVSRSQSEVCPGGTDIPTDDFPFNFPTQHIQKDSDSPDMVIIVVCKPFLFGDGVGVAYFNNVDRSYIKPKVLSLAGYGDVVGTKNLRSLVVNPMSIEHCRDVANVNYGIDFASTLKYEKEYLCVGTYPQSPDEPCEFEHGAPLYSQYNRKNIMEGVAITRGYCENGFAGPPVLIRLVDENVVKSLKLWMTFQSTFH